MPSETEGYRARGVLFVRTANVCRSPTAEAIFGALVAEMGVRYGAGSAGIAALVDEPIAPHAWAALAALQGEGRKAI